MKGLRSLVKQQRSRVKGTLTRRQTMLFVLFLILSLVLWFLVVLQDTYVAKVRVPIVVHEISSDLALSTPLPSHIEVEIRDNGFALFNYMLPGSIKPIELSFTPSEEREGYQEWSMPIIENELFKRFIVNGRRTKVISFSPLEIAFSYSPKAKREVPIDFKAQVVPSPGVLLSDIRLNPDNVIVYGSRQELDQLEVLPTDTITYTDIAQNDTLRIPLVVPKGMTVTPPYIMATVEVEKLVQRVYQVPISHNYSNGEYVLRLFPMKVEVTCVAPANRIPELTAVDLKVVLEDEEQLHKRGRGKIRVRLEEYPHFVQMIQCDPQEVEYLIEER